MDVEDALERVAQIREQMARTQTFRGYRAGAAAFSGMLAIAAAVLQAHVVPEPAKSLRAYLGLWVGVAAISMAVFAVQVAARYRRDAMLLHRQLTLVATAQFLPCVFAGTAMTVVIYTFAPEVAWVLPGLWSVVFSLGLFASRPNLPTGVGWVGAYYLLAGLVTLSLARGEHAFSPWAMGATFGPGQLLAAGVLYWNLERSHAEED